MRESKRRSGGPEVSPTGVGILSLLLVLAPGSLAAQGQGPPPTPCIDGDAVHREFDFWIGSWDVYQNGRRIGGNVVEPILEGCTLLENWTSATGSTGKSFNWVDRSSFREPRWRQLWIDQQGNTLDYTRGRLEDGAMRFEGHTFDAQGDSIPQRLVFIDQAPDTVIQIFSQSNDGGDSWTETWRGIYVRIDGGAPGGG